MKEKTKTVRINSRLHSTIKLESFMRNTTLELLVDELIRSGLGAKHRKQRLTNGGAK